MQLTRSSQREVWVLGNLFVLTGRSQPAIRGMQIVCLAALSVEDIEDIYLFSSMIIGFADWIRLCPGLFKNSEDGNSCPKSHKAARFG